MKRDAARDAVVVALAKVGVSAVVLATGFHAVSDDDFARVVIAQRFAADPALDPTGTSWLPFPFWLQGSVMALFGRSVDVARATSFVLGVASVLGVFLAARWAEVPRRAAAIGATVAGAIPYAAWLGVATVPDLPTAALSLIGIGASVSTDVRRRALGGGALFLATLSRYEAWPIAAGFALLCAVDAARKRRAVLLGPLLIALAGPLAWLVHGAISHGDPLFFVARVSAYKRAVGGASPLLHALIGQPLAVLRCEPELAGATLVVLASAIASGQLAVLRRHARPLMLLGLMLAFLVVGELRASGATHHAERAVLAIWLWLAVLGADLASAVWPKLGAHGRAAAAAATLAAILLGAFVLRPWYARRDSFIDRQTEVAIGRRAAEFAAAEDRLVVDTPDFGFYAVIAGFARPDHARPLDDRDPRRARSPDPFASETELRSAVGDSRWLVAHGGEHAGVGGRLGAPRELRGDYVLIELSR